MVKPKTRLGVGVDCAELGTHVTLANGVDGVAVGVEGKDHVKPLAERHFSYEGGGFDAGEGAYALKEGRIKRGIEVLTREAIGRDGHAADEYVVCPEAEGDVA